MYWNGKKDPGAAILTPAEVEALLRACSDRASTGMRNRALIIAMYDAGLRVSEVLALRPADLDPTTSTITAGSKGKAPRIVLLAPTAFAIIERWLDRRAALGLGTELPLFCTLRGRPIQTPYIRALLPRLARRVGIAKRVHPRGLRDAHAAQLAANRVPPELVQARLGHGSRVTTDRLLRRLAPHLSGLGSPADIENELGGSGVPPLTPGSPAYLPRGDQRPGSMTTQVESSEPRAG